jgi:predicted nucleic acid-binding protein
MPFPISWSATFKFAAVPPNGSILGIAWQSANPSTTKYCADFSGVMRSGKLRDLQRSILPLFTWEDLEDLDWEQAARFWAEARRKGQQLGNPDLLLAALASRQNAVIVSVDTDYDALPIRREDWRV